MKNYVKPSFEYVVLAVEEKFASGSAGCTVFGSCPTDCDSFSYGGIVYPKNLNAPN